MAALGDDWTQAGVVAVAGAGAADDDDDDDVSIFSCDRCTLKILNLKNKYFYSISRRVCLFIFISLAVDTVFRLDGASRAGRPSYSCVSIDV